jgi:hypothetical protein
MPRTALLALPLLLLAACGGTEAILPDPDAGVSTEADAGSPDSGVAEDAGFADAGFEDAGVPLPTFAADVAPILELQCQGCHFVTDNPPQILIQGTETRSTYERLVSRPARGAGLSYITPGDPEQSYLLRKIEGTHRAVGGMGNPMPPPAARRRVPAEDVATIRAWIEAGAPFE